WARYPLDYVIGSVHWLDRWSIFSDRLPAGRSVQAVYEEYWLTTQQAALSGAYDIIGHIDCIKTRGYVPARPDMRLIERTLQVLAECGTCIELNTSGWRKSCAEQYPAVSILERAHHYGVAVTVGSDAHAPHLVAADIDRAFRLLREIGFTHVATFSQRQRRLIPLP
ncbi:MAG TPA: histidinol phosphate phosphatase, partial [Limnochordia bacterium]